MGTRFYSMPTFEVGSTNFTYGCRGLTMEACQGAGLSTNLNALGLDKTYTGHKSKVSLSWKATDDVLL